MSKHNSLSKKFKNQYLSINNSIESYFNNLKFYIKNIKKLKFNQNNRVFLVICVIVILTLIFFLMPTFYNKNIIQSKIQNHVSKKYNIDLKFNEKISYGLLPKPHYLAKNLTILNENGDIAIAKNLKVFIAIKKFFFINEIEIKDLVFKKTDFEISYKDLPFFYKLLKTAPNENKIIIKDSNIFFKDKNNETLFINKIYESQFSYDSKNLQNILTSKNEIFNLPFKLNIRNDKFNKKILSKFNSPKIRLSLENETDYSELDKKGILDILFINKSTSLLYNIKKDSLEFASEQRNSYRGLLDFKPFYFSAKFNYNGLSTRNLFNKNSVFVDLIKSEFLNNKNLNAQIELNIKDITNIDELNNLLLKIEFQEGEINLSNSSIMWKDDLKINLNESLINHDNGEITLIGKLILEFKNLNNFYRFFQIKKKDRKKIQEIQLDFVYNINDKTISFDNVKIDKKSNEKIDNYVSNYNNKKDKIFNKITFKNFTNNFFGIYDG